MTYYPPIWFEERLAESRKIAPVLSDVGALVWDCVVPAEWCPPGNKRDSMHWSKAHKLKQQMRQCVRWYGQLDIARPLPLPGRPVVTCYRYTPHRTDPRANWDKFPVDMLTPLRAVPTKKGVRNFGCLGIIRDDSGDHIDLRAEWVKSKLGCVYVRVFSGAS